MKDILDQEIKIGDLIAYTTIIGRSANLSLYEVRGFTDNGSGDEWDRAIRASVTQLEESLR